MGGKAKLGLTTRLASHAAGRLSGDQFCVYVANRLVISGLGPEQLAQFADGSLTLDTLTRQYIHGRLEYQFLCVETSAEAYRPGATIPGWFRVRCQADAQSCVGQLTTSDRPAREVISVHRSAPVLEWKPFRSQRSEVRSSRNRIRGSSSHQLRSDTGAGKTRLRL